MIKIKISESAYATIKYAVDPHSTGQGTDIHITKIAPGSEFGQGYIVEIFDYGQKVDELFAPTKKRVVEIIKEQKERYNTNRAFEQELKVHVTYKSPGGQGFKHQGSTQEVEDMDIEQILLEKAARINNLIATVEDPSIPRKVRKALDPAFQSIQPASPILTMDEGTEIRSQEELVEFLKNDLVEYFSSGAAENYAPGENPENIVSEQLANVRHIIERDDPNHQIFDLNAAAESLKNIFKDSGLPGEGILFKNKGIQKAANLEEDKLVSRINIEKGDPTQLHNSLKSIPDVKEKIEAIAERPDKTEAEVLLSKLSSTEYREELLNMFKYASKDFWKYLRNYNGINTLGKVYSEWEKRVNPLVVNRELKPILKEYILDEIESFACSSEETRRDVFSKLVDNYKSATTIIINEKEGGKPEIIEELPDKKEDMKAPAIPANAETRTTESDSQNLGSEPLTNSATQSTILDTLRSE